MTLKEAKKLKVQDRVRWPEGANGCTEDIGTVCAEMNLSTLYVKWDNGERTYLHDESVVRFIVKEVSQ
jgi:hypothetical protein